MSNEHFPLLKGFPHRQIDVAANFYENVVKHNPKSLYGWDNLHDGVSILVSETPFLMILDREIFLPRISYLISQPNMGRSEIHTDRSQNTIGTRINIPIIVDHATSQFIAGKNEDLDSYKLKGTKTLHGKTAYQFHLEPEKFDIYDVAYPMILNGNIPHGWTHYGDQVRVIAQITSKFSSPNDLFDYCKRMEWF